MNRLAVVLLPVALASCGIDLPLQQGCGVPPGTEANVDVSVSAITLGDQCGSSGAALVAGDCAPGFAESCGICRASSVQLDIASSDHRDLRFTVVEVYLFDPSTGALVDTLEASAPTKWDGRAYKTWDQNVASRTNLKVKYTLTAPDWGRISPNGRLSSPQRFNTQVLVNINGELRTLKGPDAFREPEVVT